MHPSSLQIKDFTYDLPEEKIARYPLPQRDQSKLLIYKNGSLSEDTYQHLEQHIPEHSLLVFNQTKVIHARLLFQKPTGGKIEVFCLEPDERYPDVQTAMLQKGSVYWKCMVGGAAKWKDGQQLSLEVAQDKSNEPLVMTAIIEEKKEGYFVLQLNWNTDLSFAEALHIAGHVPLPPYLNRAAELSDETRYQTIFAKEEGSVAAPTAALHFTENVLNKLTDKDIATGFVTLHVGAGTFKPVKSETMHDHDMHAEWIEITPGFIQQIIEQLNAQKPLIAVGTTSARTLESLYWIGVRLKRNDIAHLDGVAVPQWYPYDNNSDFTAMEIFEFLKLYMHNHQMNKLITRTQIIIAPGYVFRVIDGLITNFHQPQSTLLLLVSALVGNAWRSIYDYALQHDFRFLSYGDGCLLWNNNA
jgi:S-adenosylmethionine:tRNA ribosyltransferase-isomerase